MQVSSPIEYAPPIGGGDAADGVYNTETFRAPELVTSTSETTSTAKPCSCHWRSGEKRNWMLLLAAAALLYVLTRKSK